MLNNYGSHESVQTYFQKSALFSKLSKAESMDIHLSAFSLIIIIVKDDAYPTAMTTFICAFNK